jgi:hypothetical protein
LAPVSLQHFYNLNLYGFKIHWFLLKAKARTRVKESEALHEKLTSKSAILLANTLNCTPVNIVFYNKNIIFAVKEFKRFSGIGKQL